MEVLLFTLYAPVAAYGDHGARTSRRGSWARPTRTATLGLVAAALGIERSAHEDHLGLHEGLGFAVRVDGTGASLTDYHTFQVGFGDHLQVTRMRADEHRGGTKTTITHREYRTDSLHTVGLWKRGCSRVMIQMFPRGLAVTVAPASTPRTTRRRRSSAPR